MSGRNTMNLPLNSVCMMNEDKRKKGKDQGKKKSSSSSNKRKKGNRVGYGRYIYKVMKQVDPKLEISLKAMTIMDNFMEDMSEKIAQTASTLKKYVGRATLTSMEIHNAVKMELPGQLAKHAMSEGAQAVIRYATFRIDEQDHKSKKNNPLRDQSEPGSDRVPVEE